MMHMFDCGYQATFFCAIQFAIRSGYVLVIPMNSTAGQVADAWEQGVKVVCICDAVQIFETCGV